MSTMTLSVLGMSCQKCVGHVTNALNEVAGVTEAVVDLGQKTATVTTDGTVTEEALAAVIVAEGFDVGPV